MDNALHFLCLNKCAKWNYSCNHSWPSLLFTNKKWFLALSCKRSILSFPIIYSLGFATAGFGGKFGAESAGTCRIIHFMLHISFSSFFPPFPIFCFIFYPCGRGLVAGLDKIIGISAGYISLLGKPIYSKVSASVPNYSELLSLDVPISYLEQTLQDNKIKP